MPKINRNKPRRPVRLDVLGMDERPPVGNHPRGILKEWPPTHAWSNGKGGIETHTGTGADCTRSECVAWREEQTAPWGYSDEHVESWAVGSEPYSQPRPDPLAPCPRFGTHRWVWGDDGKGHSGDVCACGAYEE